MMTVSFIVPVYNCKTYLPGCVDSIRSAGISDYEILLIDDGSTDGSGAVCDELARQNPDVRVIHQSNAGVSAARNRGLREARGEKILFIDSDDTVDSAALAKVLKDSGCDQNDLTIFGASFDYYHHGKCYRRDPLFYERSGVLTKGEWGREFLNLFNRNSLSPLWNKVFKKSIIEKYGLRLNEEMFLYEDLEFTLRYMTHCDSIWNVPAPVYHYRQSEDEGNAGRRLARIDSISTFLEPIERAMTQLVRENPAIGTEQKDQILQALYLILAREKIACSDVGQIRNVCRDFQQWARTHALPLKDSAFQERLMGNHAVRLWLANQKTMIRHRVAVWVKANLSVVRKGH